MKVYFADTNIFIRFLIGDNLKQAKQAGDYFALAKAKKIQIVVLSEIILEIDYVFKKVYGLSRLEISQKLSDLVSSPYFDPEDRSIWIRSFDTYRKTSFDLVDIFLFEKAKSENGEVLSFDRDFKKLKKLKI